MSVAIGFIAAGVGLIANEIAHGTYDMKMIAAGIASIGSGLKVIGEGPERKRLEMMAGPTVLLGISFPLLARLAAALPS